MQFAVYVASWHLPDRPVFLLLGRGSPIRGSWQGLSLATTIGLRKRLATQGSSCAHQCSRAQPAEGMAHSMVPSNQGARQ